MRDMSASKTISAFVKMRMEEKGEMEKKISLALSLSPILFAVKTEKEKEGRKKT